ncbi:sulfatase family protein [Sinomicrobium soli]|uniref:sulfatase family protein n=1 Tax=Sinomicrobium sp. N-1-3-6 TaxID=2219864 RepID=UPI000DCC975B|nr:sulfatase [Sinomicrobium sp. N-1-3-6]RAV28209.1 heparan N-sulfatase [Sinomicrobium sp. N-1-3-6]
MKKTHILVILLLFDICTSLMAQEHKKSPNIIFMLTDDISRNDLGAYGGPYGITPELDRMAEKGMVFTEAYVTSSSCSPSRCSMITGRYPHNTGAPELHNPLPRNQVMFPGLLKEKGYYTVLSGKNHMGPHVSQAFDTICDGVGPGGQQDWVKILEERPKDRPFFFWFASYDAHRDWQYDNDGKKVDTGSVKVPPMLFDGSLTRSDLQGYLHEVSRVDYYLGKLMKALKEQGEENNTYVIFTSDNGRPFPRCKTRMYDSGSKVPLMVTGPGVKPGSSGALTSTMDIAPTILEWAGIPVPEEIQGVSFDPVVKGRKESVRDFLFAEHNWHVFQAHERMVRWGDWMYIRNAYPERRNLAGESTRVIPSGKELWDAHADHLLREEQQDVFLVPRPHEELYNVREDPYQFYNKAGVHKEITVFLRSVLRIWTLQTGDSEPRSPTNDREDEYGRKNNDFARGEKPGASTGAVKMNHPGPVFMEDVLRSGAVYK